MSEIQTLIGWRKEKPGFAELMSYDWSLWKSNDTPLRVTSDIQPTILALRLYQIIPWHKKHGLAIVREQASKFLKLYNGLMSEWS